MEVSATTQYGGSTGADTVVVGVLSGRLASADAPPEVAALLSSGEARDSFKSLALTHADGKRWLTVGLGKVEDFTPERARVAAAVARDRARELATSSLCWQVPDDAGEQIAAALVEGTILSDYRFERHKSTPAEVDADAAPKHLRELIVQAPTDLSDAVADAALVAEAVNSARDLQNRPANDLTPTALGAYAESLARDIDGLSVEVEGREEIIGRGMGAFAAVAQGSDQEPALITMRYEGADAKGPTLGYVGKAVTFDSGGISLKPGAKMAEMKFDMSGGAAVIEAVAAIARLGLPVKLVAVVGATETLPSGHA
ncbi:MAG: M17 family peptidase N-terminal domain-containing protein, partial [Solirubrobacteraceae bacterium]